MRAVAITEFGGPEKLAPIDVPVPRPGAGESLVKLEYAGVNFIDVYMRSGHYARSQTYQTPLPMVIGMEGIGTVASGPAAGQRVAYCLARGAYAEYAAVPAWKLVPVPVDMPSSIAVALMLQGLTAHYLSHSAFPLEKGHTCLVHAAAGGVGLLLCQWAKHIGATVIGTVGSDEKARLARDNGCDYPIVTAREDFAARVGELTKGLGCDVVYDSVGAATFAGSLAALARCGHLVSYGQASGPVPPVDPAALSAKSGTLSRPVLFHYTADPAALREIAGRTFEALRRGIIRATINQRFALRDAAAAHRELEARRTTGASVLLP